jgi:hypothetical protein
MSYAIEHQNERPTEADGPYRTGTYRAIDEAKAAGQWLAQRDGLTNVVIRDNGDRVSVFAGNLVSELVDGEWHDRDRFDAKNWWPKLDDETRSWLLEHADEQIPFEILHRVVAVGGIVPGTQWEGQDEYDFRLPESAVARIQQNRPW